MGRIHQLDDITANGIAAGEVVERPSSVVKELIENAMDAGATTITVEIDGGGVSRIRVTDDGSGMDEQDARMAFQCHTTSKLNTLEDLFDLHTMGFRGEALSSIAAASKVRMRTCQPGFEHGTQIEMEAGRLIGVTKSNGAPGTQIEVRDLFFNLPARYKFLKKDQTEAQYISQLIERLALVRPDISFRLIQDGKESLHTPGNNDDLSALYSVYGKKTADQCIRIDTEIGAIKIVGFVGKPEIARGTRNDQIFFLNERLIRSKTISAAVDEAYRTMLMKGKFAFIILSIFVPPSQVDINVHPQKAEVRFWSDKEVFHAVFHAVHNALSTDSHVIIPDTSALFRTSSPQSASSTNPTANPNENDNIHMVSSDSHDFTRATETIPAKAEDKIDNRTEFHYPVQEKIPLSVSDHRDVSEQGERETEGELSKIAEQTRLQERRQGFSIQSLLQARIIGTAFATYILLELDDSIFLLDQHAAHEKVLFEQLLKKYQERRELPIVRKSLLSPELLTLTSSEYYFAQEKHSQLEKLGFVFDLIAGRDCILREIPDVSQNISPARYFQSALDDLRSEVPSSDEEMIRVFATTACKAAVKGHDRLARPEIEGLLKDLSFLNDPYHCPHGRPIIIRLGRKDLEKEFKRVL